jgi:hypothetical protein
LRIPEKLAMSADQGQRISIQDASTNRIPNAATATGIHDCIHTQHHCHWVKINPSETVTKCYRSSLLCRSPSILESRLDPRTDRNEEVPAPAGRIEHPQLREPLQVTLMALQNRIECEV